MSHVYSAVELSFVPLGKETSPLAGLCRGPQSTTTIGRGGMEGGEGGREGGREGVREGGREGEGGWREGGRGV